MGETELKTKDKSKKTKVRTEAEGGEFMEKNYEQTNEEPTNAELKNKTEKYDTL